MSGARRAVITGMGAVTAAGVGVPAFWSACIDGRAHLAPARKFDAASWSGLLVGEVPDLLDPMGQGGAGGRTSGPHAGSPSTLPGGVDAGAQSGAGEPAADFALTAAREALRSAGFPPGAELPASSGVSLGTCLGGALLAFEWLERRIAAERVSGGPPRLAPEGIRGLTGTDGSQAPGAAHRRGDAASTREARLLERATLSAPASALARAWGLTGPVSTLSSACASGTAAVNHAACCIRRGEADLMLAGGTDALSLFVLSGFALLGALTAGRMKPFDRRRDGLSLGEGAAILVVEERNRAMRRGAPILAEILGTGSGADANHMTGPSPTGDGVARAVEAALRDARLRPEGVDYVSAHGTGTPYNDRMETIALKRALGKRAKRVPVSSIKPIVGHTLGAAGALEAVVCVKTIQEGRVPPTINYADPDPECDLDYVPNEARAGPIGVALSSSSAFAGSNAALVLGRA